MSSHKLEQFQQDCSTESSAMVIYLFFCLLVVKPLEKLICSYFHYRKHKQHVNHNVLFQLQRQAQNGICLGCMYTAAHAMYPGLGEGAWTTFEDADQLCNLLQEVFAVLMQLL